MPPLTGVLVGLPSAIPISEGPVSLRDSGVGILIVGTDTFRGGDVRGLISGVGSCPRVKLLYDLNPAPTAVRELMNESSLDILLSYLKLLLAELLELKPLDELGLTDILTSDGGEGERVREQHRFTLTRAPG